MARTTQSNGQPWPKFVAICSCKGRLTGLDQEGGVWQYYPRSEKSFAFWTKLTEARSDGSTNKGQPRKHQNDQQPRTA